MFRPKSTIKRVLKGTIRSSLFLAVFVTIYQVSVCLQRNLHYHSPLHVPDHRYLYFLYGLFSGTSILLETPGRQLELALYTLPKAVECLVRLGMGKGWRLAVPYAEAWMCSLGMGYIMSAYQSEPECISPWLRGTLRGIFGAN